MVFDQIYNTSREFHWYSNKNTEGFRIDSVFGVSLLLRHLLQIVFCGLEVWSSIFIWPITATINVYLAIITFWRFILNIRIITYRLIIVNRIIRSLSDDEWDICIFYEDRYIFVNSMKQIFIYMDSYFIYYKKILTDEMVTSY